jgi:hypothetical protein
MVIEIEIFNTVSSIDLFFDSLDAFNEKLLHLKFFYLGLFLLF